MKSCITRKLLVAVALAAIGGSAVAGMSMGSSSSRNDDRGSGYYPGYGSGISGRPCRGNGPCTRDADSQDYGQGMRMGGGQNRQQYRRQYRYGQGGPGYGRGGQGYAPRVPDNVQEDQEEYRGYPRGGPGYGRGGSGYAPGAPVGEPGDQAEYQGYPRGGPGYGRGSQGYRQPYSSGEQGGQGDYRGNPQGGPGYGRGGQQGGAPYYRQGGGF